MKEFIVKCFALIIFNLLVGCAHNPYLGKTIHGTAIRQCFFPIMYGVSKNVPEEFRQSIRDGLNYWNDQLQAKIFLDLGDLEYHPQHPETNGFLMVGVVDDEYFKGEDVCAVVAYKYLDRDACIVRAKILLRNRGFCMSDPFVVNTILRHEGGHVLGLGHWPKGNLMYSRVVIADDHPVPATNAEIQTVYKLYEDIWSE